MRRCFIDGYGFLPYGPDYLLLPKTARVQAWKWADLCRARCQPHCSSQELPVKQPANRSWLRRL